MLAVLVFHVSKSVWAPVVLVMCFSGFFVRVCLRDALSWDLFRVVSVGNVSMEWMIVIAGCCWSFFLTRCGKPSSGGGWSFVG